MKKKKEERRITLAHLLCVIEVIAEHALGLEESPEQKALGSIYRYSHIAWSRCKHPDWDKQFWKDYDSMKRAKLFDPVEE